MKKNILVTLVVIMVVVAGYLAFKNIEVAPINDKVALDQLLTDQKKTNPSVQGAQTQKSVQQTQTVQQTNQTNQTNQQKTMGLEIKTTQEGIGAVVKTGDTVSVLYTGKLMDGTVFDASIKHGNQPFEFTVGAGMVIKGWDQGLLGAKVGEKRTLTIPGDLAYGPGGIPGTIPPNATLIFDIEVLAIK